MSAGAADAAAHGRTAEDGGAGGPCLACGACCAYSAQWPRFTLEDEAALALIPAALVDASGGRMRAQGDRCAALEGTVGISTRCTIYAVRPLVCRDCEPGDHACLTARARFGLGPV